MKVVMVKAVALPNEWQTAQKKGTRVKLLVAKFNNTAGGGNPSRSMSLGTKQHSCVLDAGSTFDCDTLEWVAMDRAMPSLSLRWDAVCIGEKDNSYKVTGGTSQEFGALVAVVRAGPLDVGRNRCCAGTLHWQSCVFQACMQMLFIVTETDTGDWRIWVTTSPHQEEL